MKKILCSIIIIFNFTISFSQVPELISYQSIIRDASGVLVQNSNVGIQISILQGSDTGSVVYNETHVVNSNENGLVTLSIGSGATTGDLASINWETGPYYIKSETDPSGGTNYTIAGTSQLLSVPYALYSKTSGNANPQVEGTEVGDMLYWDGNNWVNIPAGLKGQYLRLSEDTKTPRWVGPSYPEVQAVITGINVFSVILDHEIISDNGAIMTKKGVCWSINPNPSITDDKFEVSQNLVFDNTIINMNITGLEGSTTYYLRPYTISNVGVGYGNEVSFTTSSATDIAIGNSYQGGIIGYILQPGDPGYDVSISQGLIVYISGAEWGCPGTTIEGTSASYGSGESNTTAILNGCSDNSAARYCNDLIIDGYDDWFMPTVEELQKISENSETLAGVLGILAGETYWSSTEDYVDITTSNGTIIDTAFIVYLGSGGSQVYPKVESALVMAVRRF